MMESEVYAKLIVESSTMSLSELVVAFHVKPFRQWSVGDEIVRPHKTFLQKTNGFSIRSTLPINASPEDHIMDICAQLKDVDGGCVRQMQGQYEAEFQIGIDKESNKTNYVILEKNFLSIASAIGASIDIDVLCLIDEVARNTLCAYDAIVDIYFASSGHCLFSTRGINAVDGAVSYLSKHISAITAHPQKKVIFHVSGESPIANLPLSFIELADAFGVSLEFQFEN